MKPLIAILGVSHKDVEATQQWLGLAKSLGTDMTRIWVAVTHKAEEIAEYKWRVPCQAFTIPDECEDGYPKSASHLFLRSLEWAETNHPGSPVLWLEADAIPLHQGWLEAIERDYYAKGLPFMGHLELKVMPPHMAGCGVYPPNWRQLAPSIARCVEAPDKGWGPGNGQAWDTYCAGEILPYATQADTIKQIWNCPPFVPGMMKLLDGVSLFHPSKDGRLISILNGTYAEKEGAYDLVYPCTGEGWDHMELMWSLRSIEKYAADLVRNVYVIGPAPAWYNGLTIQHERVDGDSGNADQLRKLIAAAQHPDVSEDFVWMNTDFYCQHRPDFEARSYLASKVMRNGQHKGYMNNTVLALRWQNVEGPYRDHELHVPMLMNKQHVITMASMVPFGDIAFRTLYGNLFVKDGAPMHDVKIRDAGTYPNEDWTWFSTDDNLFANRSRQYDLFMESKYPLPSKWELK